jgi:hypothetical protein
MEYLVGFGIRDVEHLGFTRSWISWLDFLRLWKMLE